MVALVPALQKLEDRGKLDRLTGAEDIMETVDWQFEQVRVWIGNHFSAAPQPARKTVET